MPTDEPSWDPAREAMPSWMSARLYLVIAQEVFLRAQSDVEFAESFGGDAERTRAAEHLETAHHQLSEALTAAWDRDAL